jgi:hypothetical protein
MRIRRPARPWIIAAALALVVAPFGINAALRAQAQSATQTTPVTVTAPTQPIASVVPTHPVASTAPTPAQAERTLQAAIDAYITSSTEVDTYTIGDEQIVGDVARVLIVPPADVTDPAFLFARKGANGWEVISIGTWFPPEFYRSENIPTELWVQ